MAVGAGNLGRLFVTLGMNIAPLQKDLGTATKNLKVWQADLVRTGQSY